MKRTLTLLLALAMLLSLAACGSPNVAKDPDDGEQDVMSISGPATPPAEAENTASPTPGDIDIDVEGTDEPEETIDPNLVGTPPTPTPDENPEVTIDPNKTPDPKNTPISAKEMPKSLSDAKKLNKDTIGWIKVPNTNISYPIMYNMKPEWYYNEHDFFKQPSSSGSIYSYYSSLTRNVIIQGHNMRKSGTMFHELHKLQNNKDSLTTKKNRIFSIDIFGYKEWEVYALYETKDNEPKSTLTNNVKHLSSKEDNSKEVLAWVEAQKKRSEVKLDVSVTGKDVLMTIITCGDNYDHATAQSRLYFFLRAVTPEPA